MFPQYLDGVGHVNVTVASLLWPACQLTWVFVTTLNTAETLVTTAEVEHYHTVLTLA